MTSGLWHGFESHFVYISVIASTSMQRLEDCFRVCGLELVCWVKLTKEKLSCGRFGFASRPASPEFVQVM